MTTSSPFGGGEAIERPQIICPEWCTTSAEDHANDDPGHALHRGGEVIRRFTVWRDDIPGEQGPVTASIACEEYGLDPTDLRELAADAIKAADWLEHGEVIWPRAATTALSGWLEAQR